MNCYRKGGCGPYEMYSCYECPASKPEYAQRYILQSKLDPETVKKLHELCLKVPTVNDYLEPARVVHGRWIMGVDEADYAYGECSVCGYVERDAFPCGRTPKYCSECGAKMDALHTYIEKGKDE